MYVNSKMKIITDREGSPHVHDTPFLETIKSEDTVIVDIVSYDIQEL